MSDLIEAFRSRRTASRRIRRQRSRSPSFPDQISFTSTFTFTFTFLRHVDRIARQHEDVHVELLPRGKSIVVEWDRAHLAGFRIGAEQPDVAALRESRQPTGERDRV